MRIDYLNVIMKKEGHSNIEIGKYLDISEGMVRKILKKSEDNK